MAFAVNEGANAIYTASLVDSSSDGISSTAFSRLTVTLYDRDTGTILNGRNKQSFLSTVQGSTNNNIVVSSSGLLTWQMQPEDTRIVNAALPTGASETHIALFEWGWDSSANSGSAEATFTVQQRSKI